MGMMSLGRNKRKVFCIGNNKTGTTSMEQFLLDHKYNVAPQRGAELLLNDYINRNWKPIINFCKKYEAFQDIPFSNMHTVPILDNHFPQGKFILTVRDDAEQWYNSISKFHSKLFGREGRLPTKQDLINGKYVSKGWIWEAHREKFGDFEDPYNKERLIKEYESQNAYIRDYFKNKANFIEVNISDRDSIKRLGEFLKIEPMYEVFPHRNKTKEIK